MVVVAVESGILLLACCWTVHLARTNMLVLPLLCVDLRALWAVLFFEA